MKIAHNSTHVRIQLYMQVVDTNYFCINIPGVQPVFKGGFNWQQILDTGPRDVGVQPPDVDKIRNIIIMMFVCIQLCMHYYSDWINYLIENIISYTYMAICVYLHIYQLAIYKGLELNTHACFFKTELSPNLCCRWYV